jgi:alkanesulfonate monooxygenase SsuD/methylene tetrahydromethanopterin reductase-like flavin-dependent oxidoreductase (luciferase family)
MTAARRLGLVFPAHAAPETLPSFARHAEELGFDALYVVEDCFLSGGIALATTALAATERLTVGIGLLPAAVRNAAITAMELGTLARLFPGRLEAGFGHGVEAWMEQIGARPPRRLAALTETVDAVRRLLSGETVDADGHFVRLRDVALETAPAEPPKLLVGTTGPLGLQAAGRWADGVILPEGCGPAFVREAVARTTAAAPAGRKPRTVVYSWLALDDDAAVAAERIAPELRDRIAGGQYPGPMRAAGLEGDAPIAVADDAIREVAVLGDPAACAAGLARLFEAGADTVALVAQGQDAEVQIERLAGEVRPLL